MPAPEREDPFPRLAVFAADRPPDGLEIDPRLDCISPRLSDMRDYWRAKCAGRAMPARADIVVTEIPHLMPAVFLADVVARGEDFRIRLVGTALTRMAGRDDSGKLTSEIPAGELCRRLVWSMRWVTARARPLRTHAAHTALPGQEYLQGESLVLPLSGGGPDVVPDVEKVLVTCDLLRPEALGGGSSGFLLARPGDGHA